MRINVITLFPQMFDALTENGITGRAIERGLLQLELTNPRDFTRDVHRTVDDRPYGGGPGMVMMYQPLHEAITHVRSVLNKPCRVIYLSPQGRRLSQAVIDEFITDAKDLVFVAGRYEGIDERLVFADIDEELSIGDYVLSGGELAAMVVIDAITRQIPSALGHEESANQDSFINGLLDYPHYTRPEEVDGIQIPPVLISGDHEKIRRWRLKNALGKTWLKRRDLLEQMVLSNEQRCLLDEFISELKP
ncbi:MAG: tRNA (guanosine(37)-N1)-methyltransferase TrmD [Gammaproteobacteria bacterium]